MSRESAAYIALAFNPMQISKITRFVFWLAGTLVVGALGNGLWELAKPALVWMTAGILDVATLGMASLRDSMYVEIARGTYERAAERMLSLGIGILTGVGLCVLLIPPILRRLKAPALSSPTSESRVRLASMSFIVIAIVYLTVQNIRMIYVIRAANHMEQLQRVVAPHLSEQQRLVFASRFASMTTKSQYVGLVNELAEVARRNSAHVPDFDIY